jgi:hypothetical protein
VLRASLLPFVLIQERSRPAHDTGAPTEPAASKRGGRVKTPSFDTSICGGRCRRVDACADCRRARIALWLARGAAALAGCGVLALLFTGFFAWLHALDPMGDEMCMVTGGDCWAGEKTLVACAAVPWSLAGALMIARRRFTRPVAYVAQLHGAPPYRAATIDRRCAEHAARALRFIDEPDPAR